MAMAGEPFYVKMPKIWGVKLVGELPDWVSAKDVILEMVRRNILDLGRMAAPQLDRLGQRAGSAGAGGESGLDKLHGLFR